MADDAQSIRSLNWRELFPFLNLFRAFRVAIHPSKLVLGFLLLIFIYGGGRVLDAIWPASAGSVATEIDAYTADVWSHDRSISFDDERDGMRESNAQTYAALLRDLGIEKDENKSLAAARHGEYHSKLQGHYVQVRNDDIAKAEKDFDDLVKSLPEDKNASEQVQSDRRAKIRATRAACDDRIRAAGQKMVKDIDGLNAITPRANFDAFFDYESRQFRHIVDSALAGQWFTGIATTNSGDLPPGMAANIQAMTGELNVGVVRGTANLVLIGPGWLLRYHPLFFALFAVWLLLIWAIFGGAIARITGVHIARDEKISVRQALRFSTSKLLSFVFAPLIPLMIIVIGGALIGVGGLLMYIPVIGPIAVGALFILAILAALIVTGAATGTVGGFNLMYPTIAVEGSDSFDAISRSFSYVFARPWRMMFYTAVSLVYGAICFLFVRFFVYVVLSLTHFFVQWFLFHQPGRYWNEIWPPVSYPDLAYHVNFQALAWPEALSALLIAMWVYIVLAFLASFVVSFYFSSNTIIYYLMRREVDATELDDVYIEEMEEDFADVSAPPTSAISTESAPSAPVISTDSAPHP